MIEQEAPRNNLVNTRKDGNTVAFGIVPTFAFGIFAYQNPPNVLTNNIEFTEFQFLENDAVNKLLIRSSKPRRWHSLLHLLHRPNKLRHR